MAKDKSEANPVHTAAKQAKKAAIRKNKATLAAARQDRLSKRDPSRLEKRLASARSSGNTREIETLERDLAAVRRARTAKGVEERAPPRREQEDRHRRRRDDEGEETDEDVRSIPMPRDTPPPMPRLQRNEEKREKKEAQMTYSAAPVLRDLKKESTATKFAPAVVRRNIALAKGEDGVVDEGEFDRLERAGYTKTQQTQSQVQDQEQEQTGPRRVEIEEVQDEDD